MTDALENVQAELSAAMVPFPDEYVESLTPGAVLFLLRQMSMAALGVVAGASASIAEEAGDDTPALNEVLNGVSMAVAGSTHALVALELLPAEAEAALEGGS